MVQGETLRVGWAPNGTCMFLAGAAYSLRLWSNVCTRLGVDK